MAHILESIRKDVDEIDFLVKGYRTPFERALGGLTRFKDIENGLHISDKDRIDSLCSIDLFAGGWYPKDCTYKEKVEQKKIKYKEICQVTSVIFLLEDKVRLDLFIDFNNELKELIKEIHESNS